MPNDTNVHTGNSGEYFVAGELERRGFTVAVPMLENPEALRAMVKATGAVNTDYQSPESVDHLCDKTTPYAENWKDTADKLWNDTCAKCGKYK